VDVDDGGSCWVWLGIAPCTLSLIQDNFSTELDQSVQFPQSIVWKKEISAIRVFLMYMYVYGEFRRDMKAHPLFGRSLLFGVSVKREFTVHACYEISLAAWN